MDITGTFLKSDSIDINEKSTYSDQVAFDLESYLSKSNDRKKRLSFVSKKIGVHTKTLQRICDFENKPTYMTVFKIYRFLLNEDDDAQLLKRVPNVIQSYLMKAKPELLESNAVCFAELEKEVSQNEVCLELIILCSSGMITSEEVVKRFGTYGLGQLEYLKSKKLVNEIQAGVFASGSSKLNVTPETIIKMGLLATKVYATPEDGYELNKHYHSFFAEGLTPEAYSAWIRIDEEAFLKKVHIARQSSSLGDIKAYTFSSTDTLQTKVKE